MRTQARAYQYKIQAPSPTNVNKALRVVVQLSPTTLCRGGEGDVQCSAARASQPTVFRTNQSMRPGVAHAKLKNVPPPKGGGGGGCQGITHPPPNLTQRQNMEKKILPAPWAPGQTLQNDPPPRGGGGRGVLAREGGGLPKPIPRIVYRGGARFGAHVQVLTSKKTGQLH